MRLFSFITQHQTSKISRRPFIQNPTFKTQHSKPNIQNPTFKTQHSKPNIQNPTFNIQNFFPISHLANPVILSQKKRPSFPRQTSTSKKPQPPRRRLSLPFIQNPTFKIQHP
jgi:hypothetical protein